MKQRTRRQWKKLIKRVHDRDTYLVFRDRYWRGETNYSASEYWMEEICDLFRDRGLEHVARVRYFDGYDFDTGNAGSEVETWVANQKYWGRK